MNSPREHTVYTTVVAKVVDLQARNRRNAVLKQRILSTEDLLFIIIYFFNYPEK